MLDLLFVLKNLRPLREAQEIIAIGPMAPSVALLLKCRCLRSCQRVYWFGLFIHSPLWIRLLRASFRILDSTQLHYVLFSQFEKTLYAKAFSFDENRMVYLPYGDLSDLETQADAEVQLVKEPDDSRCFFSGGYSNRDYLSLIETFRSLPFKLIIVCSALNTEIREAIIPPNVKVLREVSSRLFDAYVKSAKACIIPIAHNTGAAGQSCLLRYMKNRKIIIATDTDVIREYITDGVSGILVNDNHESMASAIRAVNANTEGYRCYAEAAYESYARHFSGEALARQLDQMLDQGRERDGN